MLCVVQHQQQLQRLQRTRQRGRAGAGCGVKLQRLHDAVAQRGGQRCVAGAVGRERRQFQKPDPVAPGQALRPGQVQRQPRLAHARGAAHGDQALRLQQGGQRGHLCVAADGRGQQRRHVAGCGQELLCGRLNGCRALGDRQADDRVDGCVDGRVSRTNAAIHSAAEAVAPTGHGFDPARRLGVVAQRLAQFTDGRLDHPFGDEAPAPHAVQKLFLRHQFLRPARQCYQQFIGLGAQRHLGTVAPQLGGGQVERERAEAQQGGRGTAHAAS